MNMFQIRTMNATDTAQVAQIIGDCYKKLAVPEAYTKDELDGLLTGCSPGAVRQRFTSYDTYLAECNRRVVGVIAIKRNEIAELFVAPEIQGQGAGKQLVAFAEETIARAGNARVRVWSASAPTFYERLGYVVVEERACDDGPLKGRPIKILEKVVG